MDQFPGRIRSKYDAIGEYQPIDKVPLVSDEKPARFIPVAVGKDGVIKERTR